MIIFIQKKINPKASVVSDEKPIGFIYGFWFIGFIYETVGERGSSSSILYMLCSNKYFSQISDNKIGEDAKPGAKQVTIHERYGNFFCLQYRKRKLNISAYKANQAQQVIIDPIVHMYNEKYHVVAYVYGAPGSGKSLLAMLVAAELNGTFCQTFNMTHPGDNFSELYYCVEPSKNKPLIILLDEVDMILDSIINKRVPHHKYIPISVIDKNGWNMFFDNIDRGYFPNVVFIMTSNQTPETYREDSSLLRAGRVNIMVELKKQDSL